MFRKIKYDGKEVFLAWEDEGGNGATTVRHELQSKDVPSPEFVAAFAALKPCVKTILGVGEEWMTFVRVQSVSLNVEESGREGCVITALKELPGIAHAPLVINTPHLKEEAAGEDGVGCYVPWMAKALRNLSAIADEFAQGGARAQRDLFAKAS